MPFLPRLALSVLLLLTAGLGGASLAWAGGYTLGAQISHYLDGALNSGWQAGVTTPAAVNPTGQPPVTVGGGLIGRGCLRWRPGSAIRSTW